MVTGQNRHDLDHRGVIYFVILLFPGIAGQKSQTRGDVFVGCSPAWMARAGAPQAVSTWLFSSLRDAAKKLCPSVSNA